MKKSLQFEIWQECNSLCKYCYLGDENRNTPKEVKLKTLGDIYEMISDLSIFEEYDNLSYIGGEFFQGQLADHDVKEAFMKVMQKTADYLRSGVIKSVWLACTMTIGEQKDLYEVLDLFKGIDWEMGDSSDGVWVVTSYDTIGRFHSQKMEDNWKFHMKNIHEKYPNIKFNTTMILTHDLITKFLNDEFSFTDYMNEYNSSLFFKQPGSGPFGGPYTSNKEAKQMMEEKVPGFYPDRKTFIKFLNKFYVTNKDLFVKLFNIKYRADDLYRNYNDLKHHMEHNIRYKDRKKESNLVGDEFLNECGHLLHYAAYKDCEKCMICDRDMVYEMMKHEADMDF